MSLNWCEKYRALSFADIRGQEKAIAEIKTFISDFDNKQKALVLHGPSGTGKTSLAYALAKELNFEIIELNASDFRNKLQIDKILGASISQKSLFAKGKLILVDEVDGISKDDRGGLQELLGIIDNTVYPIIITANDIWPSQFIELRKRSKLINVKEIGYKTAINMLAEICKKENVQVSQQMLTSIAVKTKGDIRAAINDLQSIANNPSATPESIQERNKEETIFNIMRMIFKAKAPKEITDVFDLIDMPLDEIMLWLEENIPNEYSGEDLARAFDALSMADVFRGRIYRQQHWRFLQYQSFFLSAGVSAAKPASKKGFTSYQKPTRVFKMWMAKNRNKTKKAIAEKFAQYVHISTRRALRDFFLVSKIISDRDIRAMNLTEEETAYLKDKNTAHLALNEAGI